MKKALLIFALALIMPSSCAQEFRERDYNTLWCKAQGGVAEYTTKDGSRADCLIDGYAVECDWARKWKEAVGQALFYAIQTDREPGILIIIKDFEKEKKHLERLNIVAKKYQIRIWEITPEDVKQDTEAVLGI